MLSYFSTELNYYPIKCVFVPLRLKVVCTVQHFPTLGQVLFCSVHENVHQVQKPWQFVICEDQWINISLIFQYSKLVISMGKIKAIYFLQRHLHNEELCR